MRWHDNAYTVEQQYIDGKGKIECKKSVTFELVVNKFDTRD